MFLKTAGHQVQDGSDNREKIQRKNLRGVDLQERTLLITILRRC